MLVRSCFRGVLFAPPHWLVSCNNIEPSSHKAHSPLIGEHKLPEQESPAILPQLFWSSFCRFNALTSEMFRRMCGQIGPDFFPKLLFAHVLYSGRFSARGAGNSHSWESEAGLWVSAVSTLSHLLIFWTFSCGWMKHLCSKSADNAADIWVHTCSPSRTYFRTAVHVRKGLLFEFLCMGRGNTLDHCLWNFPRYRKSWLLAFTALQTNYLSLLGQMLACRRWAAQGVLQKSAWTLIVLSWGLEYNLSSSGPSDSITSV